MAVVQTWANAWNTSSRMHEDQIFPCIFGCEDGRDELEHYLVCEPLWTAVISHSFKRSELLQGGPIDRLSLCCLSEEWMQMIAIAFSCYHAVKLSHRDEIVDFVESGNPNQVIQRLFSYADLYGREILGTD